MTEEITNNLLTLKLSTMARDYQELAKVAEKQGYTFEKYLGELIKSELLEKHQIKVKKFIKEASLPMIKTTDAFDFKKRTGINQKQFMKLCEGSFLKEATNVVFFGNFSLGKTHLALALTQNLCQNGYRCLFTQTNTLIEQLILAKKNMTILNLMKKLDKYDLIACDELGYVPQESQGADLFFQLISQRSERKSMLFTTNLTYSEWDKVFINPLTTSAAVERIIANCETFHLEGPSFRKEQAEKKQKALTKSQNETTI